MAAAASGCGVRPLRTLPSQPMLENLHVDDPEQRFAAVRLCSDLPLQERDFVRENGGWVLRLPETRVSRLEYQLELLDHDGNAHVVCDPDNPQRAPGAFGEKSVLLGAGLRASRVAGAAGRRRRNSGGRRPGARPPAADRRVVARRGRAAAADRPRRPRIRRARRADALRRGDDRERCAAAVPRRAAASRRP